MGDGAPPTLEVTTPLTVNTINRTVYWYSADQAVLMQQSLDGGEPEVWGHRSCESSKGTRSGKKGQI